MKPRLAQRLSAEIVILLVAACMFWVFGVRGPRSAVNASIKEWRETLVRECEQELRRRQQWAADQMRRESAAPFDAQDFDRRMYIALLVPTHQAHDAKEDYLIAQARADESFREFSSYRTTDAAEADRLHKVAMAEQEKVEKIRQRFLDEARADFAAKMKAYEEAKAFAKLANELKYKYKVEDELPPEDRLP